MIAQQNFVGSHTQSLPNFGGTLGPTPQNINSAGSTKKFGSNSNPSVIVGSFVNSSGPNQNQNYDCFRNNPTPPDQSNSFVGTPNNFVQSSGTQKI